MQERVLSLIPRKPDGKYVHGAKADFARMLGFKSGAIVSDWESGKSDSYKNYLFQISALKGVSVEWLKGETDDPGIKKAPESAKKEPAPLDELLPGYARLTEENKRKAQEYIALLLNAQRNP